MTVCFERRIEFAISLEVHHSPRVRFLEGEINNALDDAPVLLSKGDWYLTPAPVSGPCVPGSH